MIRERKSIRLQGYNYSSDNLYFVTSCVHDRLCCFGEIVRTGRDPSLPDGAGVKSIAQMHLTQYGEIAVKQWNWLSVQYRYVRLHSFVIMPNHIHGIIEINHSRIVTSGSIKIKPLSELMGAYKTTVSKHIHLAGLVKFKWQRSFYEHIIHDEKSLETINEYIINNPLNWKDDEFYN
jgi:putative transposase